MKKKIILFAITFILISILSISLASGELVESTESSLGTINTEVENVTNDGENEILIDNDEKYDDLLDENKDENQDELKSSFNDQAKELMKVNNSKEEKEEKFVITKVLSDIKSQYTTDYYYYYLIKYQEINIRTASGDEIPAIAILSYDVSDNKSIKPLKAGDTVFGYIQYVSKTDSNYNMVNHDLKDDRVAYVSIENQDRTLGIVLLTLFTLLLFILYTGKNGAKMLIPVFVAIDLLFVVLVPELEIGRSVLIVSILIALELIVLITVIKNGWNKKTLVSIISSIIVVVLLTTLGVIFGNANGFTGKGIVSEENYDLLSNVYYIDILFKSTIGTYDLYLAILILATSVVSACVCSKITNISEKYAGTEGMINSIIEESKKEIIDYPFIIGIASAIIILPTYMINKYNQVAFENVVNSESFVTYLAIGLIAIISSIIASPITAIISYLFMGKVEVKQISENS